MTEDVFVPRKGMSYVISRKVSELNDEEKEYRSLYRKYLKSRCKLSPEEQKKKASRAVLKHYYHNRDAILERVKQRNKERRKEQKQKKIKQKVEKVVDPLKKETRGRPRKYNFDFTPQN